MTPQTDLRLFGLKAKDLKCFEDWQGFDSIYPVNLIVGRNNAGKSALLDMVWQILKGLDGSPEFSRGGRKVALRFSYTITRELIESLFPRGMDFTSGHVDLYDLARQLTGVRITWEMIAGEAQTQHFCRENEAEVGLQPHQWANALSGRVGNPFKGLTPIRLRADRDVRPERPGPHNPVGDNGEHATRLVEHFLHETRRHDLVERDLIEDLNRILHPDWVFRRIFPKRAGAEGSWELNLEDSAGRVVPISHLGSGVKTLLLVLVNLHLVPPVMNNPDLSKYVFCFEELENNLHPAVQRRLFRYLRDKAVKEKCTFFLTTHSSAVIDLFRDDESAQIVHVRHDGRRAVVEAVSQHLHRCRVIEDLDVRASDLLQSNALVWVEGPSDRLYFNKWVEEWSDGELQEHVHYQCVWYGGSLLANVTYAGNDADEDLVAALRVNRHAIVLMDSDRRAEGDQLKARVQRVCDEANRSEVYAWVTAGREVENYVPVEALRLAVGDAALAAPGRYDGVYEHTGQSAKEKMALAKRVVLHLTKETLAQTADLAERLDHVCNLIRSWNGLPERASCASA